MQVYSYCRQKALHKILFRNAFLIETENLLFYLPISGFSLYMTRAPPNFYVHRQTCTYERMNQAMLEKDLIAGFLTIKKFAELVGMKPSKLRHYDDEDVFVPAMRSMLNKNNDRLYSPTQIITAKMIRVLSEIGVPLKTHFISHNNYG